MNNENQKINVLWLLLRYHDMGPHLLMLVLAVYAFALFIIAHFLSIAYRGTYELAKERWVIIAIAVCFIEMINQFSYWFAKINIKRAIAIKAISFWVVFTTGMGVYIYLLTGINKEVTWDVEWHKQILAIIIYLCLSWGLPIYSFSTKVRFLLLYDKFMVRHER